MTKSSTSKKANTVPVYDILNCGPRSRFGANGKLVHNSDKINLQNLRKRSGDITLRRSICAPEGHVIIASDSSQIEARMLAFAANEQYMVDIFMSRRCPYSDMAAKIYNKTYDEVYKAAKIDYTKEGITHRNVGKETVLGCIAEGTEVLTNRGWVAIETLRDSDLLWDGTEYVPHSGLIDKGHKECIDFNGTYMTPDHKVYDGVEWEEARHASTVRTGVYALRNLPDQVPS